MKKIINFLLPIFLSSNICFSGQISSNSPGLKCLWHFNEASGTIAKDQISGADFTVNGTWITGIYGNQYVEGTASVYNGVTTKYASALGLTGNNAVTVMAVVTWLMYCDTSGYKQIWTVLWGQNVTGSSTMNIALFNGAYGFANHWGLWPAGLNWQDGGALITLGKKYVLTIVWNPTDGYMRFYTNGIQTNAVNFGSINLKDSLLYSNTGFVGDSVGTKTFYLEEQAIWSRALPAYEVKRITQEILNPVGGGE